MYKNKGIYFLWIWFLFVKIIDDFGIIVVFGYIGNISVLKVIKCLIYSIILK